MAFGANSVLNRPAIAGGAETGPAAFAPVRVASGAVVLLALPPARHPPSDRHSPVRPWGAQALTIYMLGFSFAYVTLQVGVGALILFGGVQITKFPGAVLLGERVAKRRWLRAGIAFAGLVVLLWPDGATAPDPIGAALMAAAAPGLGRLSPARTQRPRSVGRDGNEFPDGAAPGARLFPASSGRARRARGDTGSDQRRRYIGRRICALACGLAAALSLGGCGSAIVGTTGRQNRRAYPACRGFRTAFLARGDADPR